MGQVSQTTSARSQRGSVSPMPFEAFCAALSQASDRVFPVPVNTLALSEPSLTERKTTFPAPSAGDSPKA